MKYILVWWLIHPGHAQVIHREVHLSKATCEAVEAALPEHARHRCSVE